MHQRFKTSMTGLAGVLMLCACSAPDSHEAAGPVLVQPSTSAIANSITQRRNNTGLEESVCCDIEWTSIDDQQVVEIYGRDLHELKSVVLNVEFDCANLRLDRFEPSDCWSDDALSLAFEPSPGIFECAIALPQPEQRSGITGDRLLARAVFVAGGVSDRQVSATPPEDEDHRPLITGGKTGILTLYYNNPGDYDLNGQVTPADIVTLARYLGTASEYEPPAYHVADGNHDGQITIADLTVIGKYLGTTVLGYAVFAADSADKYPAEVTAPNPADARLFHDVPVGRFIQRDPYTDEYIPRLDRVEVRDERFPYEVYWARPYAGGAFGSPSAMIGSTGVKDGILVEPNRQITGMLQTVGGSYTELRHTRHSDAFSTVIQLEMHDAVSLAAVGADIHFDPARYNPSFVTQFGGFVGKGKIIHIARGGKPLDVRSYVMLPRTYGGISGNIAAQTITLKRGPDDGELPAFPPLPEVPAAMTNPQLSWNEEQSQLEWLYNLPWDADQNTMISIADMTPLGLYFGQAVPSVSSAAQLMDGNGDGFVDFWDLDWLGAHFGLSHYGFTLYRSPWLMDYPRTETSFEPLYPYDFHNVNDRDYYPPEGGRFVYKYPLEESDRGVYYWLTGAGYISDPVFVPELL